MIEQRLFSEVKRICESSGIKTYEYLPNDDVGYPFVFVGEQFGNSVFNNKDKRLLSVTQTVHVYHNNYMQRGTLSSIMSNITSGMMMIDKVDGRQLNVRGQSMQILPDNSIGIPLLHGVIEVTYEIV